MFLVVLVIFFIIGLFIYFYIKDRKDESGSSGKKYKRSLKSEIKGAIGEYKLKNKVNRLTFLDEGYTLRNLYIPTNNGRTTEIDLVLVHRTGVYVFENKNYKGNIYGNSSSKYWVQYLGKDRNNFYNPIFQNKGHIRNLARVLNFPQDFFINVVVFSSNARLTIDNYDSNVVIKKADRVWELKHLLKERPILFADSEVEFIVEKLKEYTNADSTTKKEHIDYVRSFSD